MSKPDAIEKRKENLKPTKLFSINAIIFDDGIIAGQLIEHVQWGRMKNQKVLYTGGPDAGSDFIAVVRGLVPSAIPSIEGLVNQIAQDSGTEDTMEAEQIGKVNVEIYSDSFVSTDFSELVKGDRGPAKAWRLHPREFTDAMGSLIGTGNLDNFKALGSIPNSSNIIDVQVGD